MEVQGPRLISIRVLLGIAGAVELPLRPGRAYHVIRIGPAQAITFGSWISNE